MNLSPFKIAVYDKSMTRRGWIGDPESVVFTPRHNQPGSVEITVSSDHVRVPDLIRPGARVVTTYMDTETISGPVRGVAGEGPAKQGTVTVTIEDDKRLLWRILGWASPTSAVTAQGTDGAYWKSTGNAETVLKAAVTANAVTRLKLPVTVAPNQNRGAVIPGGVALRFHQLAERLITPVEQAGLGVTVVQTGPAEKGTGFLVDVYQPKNFIRPLNEDGGTIVDWKWNQAPPEATRVVAGGSGEGTARQFVQVSDVSRETEWGDVIEVFRDARDADDLTTLNARAQESLTEGAPSSGLSLTLAETPVFRYGGNGVRVGDTVTAHLANGVTITDLLRSATISWTDSDGLTVLPTVGDITDDPTQELANAVSRLAGATRAQVLR